MREPTLLEYIVENEVLFVFTTIVLGFAVVGIFAVCEEIFFMLKRRRYRKEHDESRRPKWVKNPRTKP